MVTGIKVDPSWTYKASLYYRFPQSASFSGSLTMSLRSSSGTVLASASLNISGSQTKWMQLNTTLQATTAPSDNNNVFCVTLNGAAATNQTVNFSLFSLFPPTYKGRDNGMRMDIAEVGVELIIYVRPGELKMILHRHLLH
jgi:alpha-N-arabinofuranosidase